MADTQGKLSIHPAQRRRSVPTKNKTARSNDRRATNRPSERGKPAESRTQSRSSSAHLLPGVFQYPQAKGKIVEGVTFSNRHHYNSLRIDFDDKTCLNFVIDPCFTLEAGYSDWKTGDEKVVRSWKPVHCSA